MEQYFEVIFYLILISNGLLFVKQFLIWNTSIKNSTKFTTISESTVQIVNNITVRKLILPMYFLVLKKKIPAIELSDEEDSLL